MIADSIIDSVFMLSIAILSMTVFAVSCKLLVRWEKIFLLFCVLVATGLGVLRTTANIKDYASYLDSYTRADVGNYHHFEPFYFRVSQFFSELDVSFALFGLIFLIATVLIKYPAIFSLAKRYQVNIVLLFLLYFSYLVFLQDLTQIRIGMALAIALYGVNLWLRGNITAASVLLGCSVFFHVSALLFVAVFIVLNALREQHRVFFLFTPFLALVIGLLLASEELHAVLANFYSIDILARLRLHTLPEEWPFSGKHLVLLLMNSVYWLSVNKTAPVEQVLPGKLAAGGLSLFYLTIAMPFSYRIYELFEIFALIQALSIYKRDTLLGVAFVGLYMALSIRAVFFITSPLVLIG